MLTNYCKQDSVLIDKPQAVPSATGSPGMQFGERLRELRQASRLSQRELADRVRVNFTYISKIENEKLDFARFPGKDLIHKLAAALNVDADELLLLAHKIPDQITKRIIERPDAFRALAGLDDRTINRILEQYCETKG